MEGDLSWELVDGVDKFLDRKIAEAGKNPTWPNYSDGENRQFLAESLGTSSDPLHKDSHFQYIGTTPEPIAGNQQVEVYEVSWKAFKMSMVWGSPRTQRPRTAS